MFDPHFQNHINEFGFLLHSIKDGSYAVVFLFSAIMSYVVPLPEIVGLILFGFAAKMYHLNFFYTTVFAIIGVIVGDNIVYRLSFFGNKYVERFNKKIREHKLIKYEHLVVDNIGKTLYFLRFIAGVRFFGPVISGTLGIKWKKFFWLNATVNILHTLLFVTIGYFAHRKIFMTITLLEIFRNILTLSSVFIAGILLSVFVKKNRSSEVEVCL